MILGTVLLTAALALFLRNGQENMEAGNASAELMPQLVEAIVENREEAVRQKAEEEATVPQETEEQIPTATQREMAVARVNGYDCIGFLAIPSLELELPVMADWNSEKLQIAPCRYWGNLYDQDLVIMAHNYQKHFGKLSQLRKGGIITFTDMEGETFEYQVMAVEILNAFAIEEMTAGEYDLTLFTCTYGGENRVTVRCDRTNG